MGETRVFAPGITGDNPGAKREASAQSKPTRKGLHSYGFNQFCYRSPPRTPQRAQVTQRHCKACVNCSPDYGSIEGF